MNANHLKHQRMRGYSVAEIIVATAIFAVIMVAALLIYDRSNQVFKQSVEAGDLQQNVRIGFEKMVADIRMTGYDFDRDGIPSGDNVYQQPDEQVEYADHAALVIRGNFDAELARNGPTCPLSIPNTYGSPLAFPARASAFP